jgi:hypothetical protein
MYVYLSGASPSPTHKSTSIKLYRETSSYPSSLESFECSFLTSIGDHEISVEEYFSNFNLSFFCFQLRKATVDHVSDTFVATNVPLFALIDAARRGNIQLVEETAQIFMEHATKLIEV